MKSQQSIIAGLIFFLLMGYSVSARAVEGATATLPHTIRGEVVDLACYLTEGAQGVAHSDCAQKCITSGLPVGIKTADNKIYLAISGEHGPANATLAPLAGKQVEAEGTVSEKDGVSLIAIKKVTEKP